MNIVFLILLYYSFTCQTRFILLFGLFTRFDMCPHFNISWETRLTRQKDLM